MSFVMGAMDENGPLILCRLDTEWWFISTNLASILYLLNTGLWLCSTNSVGQLSVSD